MAIRALVAALVIALSGSAAATPEAFRCEARGGPAWREYRTAHFVVDTDLSQGDVRVLVARLEELHALELQAMVGEVVEIPGHLRVIAFRDPRQFEELAGPDLAAFYSSGYGEPTIVLQSVGLQVKPEHVAFENATHLSRFLFPRQPAWFGYGLGHFLETLAIPRTRELAKTGTNLVRGATGGGGRWAGLMPRRIDTSFRTMGLMSARELLAWDGRIEHAAPSRGPLSAWLLYHYLWNRRSKQLSDYQKRLSDGEAPARAWHAAFPEYDADRPASLEALDAELLSYRRGGRFTAFEVAVPGVDARTEEHALASADVHVIIASVRSSRYPRAPSEAEVQALRRADIEEALREDPTHPIAIVEHARLDGTQPAAKTLGALRAAVAARPRDWRAWYQLGNALGAPGDAKEREASYRKAVSLEGDAAAAQNRLAWSLVESGRPRDALPFANRAVDLAPWNPGFVDTLAVVANEIGQCPQALQLARRALDALPPGESARAVQRHVEEFERRCGTPTVASPAPLPERP